MKIYEYNFDQKKSIVRKCSSFAADKQVFVILLRTQVFNVQYYSIYFHFYIVSKFGQSRVKYLVKNI